MNSIEKKKLQQQRLPSLNLNEKPQQQLVQLVRDWAKSFDLESIFVDFAMLVDKMKIDSNTDDSRMLDLEVDFEIASLKIDYTCVVDFLCN